MIHIYMKGELSNKIDKGFIHVKKHTPTSHPASKSKSKNNSYSKYLNRKNTNEKIIKVSPTRRVRRSRKSNKSGSKKIKGIPILIDTSKKNNITIKPELNLTMKPCGKNAPKKVTPVITNKAKVSTGSKVRISPRRVVSSKKNNMGRSRRSGSRRISITRNRRITPKQINHIRSTMKQIKGKKTTDIKKELEQNGVKLTGKSPSLLKDIYIYSKLCGINIKRE
jgi:hypothetical protein